MTSTTRGARRLRTLLLIPALLLPSLPLHARRQSGATAAVAELRIRVTGELAALAVSGVLPFPSQGRNAVLAVEALDAAGRPVAGAQLAPTWATSDSEVVSLYDAPTSPTMRVVAQQDGRATVTVSALGKSASIPVVVGKARERISAAELTPAFRVARLEVSGKAVSRDDPDAALRGRSLMLGENGHAVVLKARAFSADGTPIPLEDFPVAWATEEPSVAELMQTGEVQTLVVGRESGRTRVTATIQGVVVAVETYVGDARQRADGSLFGEPAEAAASAAGALTTPPSTGAARAAAHAPAAARHPASSRLTPGPAPANVTATVTGVGTVTLSWSPAVGATAYAISRSANAGGPFSEASTAPGSASSLVVKGVRPGTAHFTVAANYSDRQPGESAPVAVTMPQPPQPKNFRASSGPGYVFLQWDPVPEAAGYTLTRQDGGVYVPLDDHVPKLPTPLLYRASFMDAEGPGGRTVGYVLGAVYKDAEGGLYTGDASALPRIPATPLPPAPDTSDIIKAVRFERGMVWVDYELPPTKVSDNPMIDNTVDEMHREVLTASGWKIDLNLRIDSTSDRDVSFLPGGSVKGYTSIVYPMPDGCDNNSVIRLRFVWLYEAIQARQVVRTLVTRPLSVTYDNPSSRCH